MHLCQSRVCGYGVTGFLIIRLSRLRPRSFTDYPRPNKGSRASNSLISCIVPQASYAFNHQGHEERITMTKHGVLGGRMDLKHFFEASVDALQDDSGSTETGNRANGRNCALVPRTRDTGLTNRALADAARALTALWRT
jgi:hypothetical protein